MEAAIAQMEILRIRAFRAMLAKYHTQGESDGYADVLEFPSDDTLDRYERRAFSRRATALQLLMSMSK
jgi:hypothetical protein